MKALICFLDIITQFEEGKKMYRIEEILDIISKRLLIIDVNNYDVTYRVVGERKKVGNYNYIRPQNMRN